MESALSSAEEKYRLLTEFTSDVIWVLNLKKQKYTYISPSIYYLTGYTPDEMMRMYFTDSLTPESVIIMREAIERGLQNFAGSGQPKILHYGDQAEMQERKCDLGRGLFKVPV
jgi:PAS domain S-box-containing protein